MPGDRVAGVLLAAGAATRFGADKLAADWNGRTVLQWSTTAMLDAGLDPVLVVVQPGDARPLPERVRTVANHRWSAGISTSVQTGLAALAGDAGVCAALIAPADQPQCGAPVYRRLLDAFRECGRGVVVATFAGAVRNPVLLARGQWRLAEEIHGDIGLSAVVQRHRPLEVECADIGSVADIDTPDDLARLRRSEV
jgi:CTP:molybdopterin cytidylyltransferase MocA